MNMIMSKSSLQLRLLTSNVAPLIKGNSVLFCKLNLKGSKVSPSLFKSLSYKTSPSLNSPSTVKNNNLCKTHNLIIKRGFVGFLIKRVAPYYLMRGKLKSLTSLGLFLAASFYFPGPMSIVLIGGISYVGFKAYRFFKQGKQLMQAFTDNDSNTTRSNGRNSKKEKDQFRAAALQGFPISLMGLFQNFFPIVGAQAQQAKMATEKLHTLSIDTINAHLDQDTTQGKQLKSELFNYDVKNELVFNPPTSTGYASSSGSSPHITIEFIARCGNDNMLVNGEGKIITSKSGEDIEIELTRLKITWMETFKELYFDPIVVRTKDNIGPNVKIAEYRDIPSER
ncbi:hypothetical protein K502DRAFT_342352 [Neoconidiobolus thromboides FSU 785]|nr:hypothetical protein K502DRAFT_342352 [Neoconidiobolus thromboides FSU 785]